MEQRNPPRPPWWPSDQPFPPAGPRTGRHPVRRRFFFRIALTFLLFISFAFGLSTALYWLVGSALGILGVPRDGLGLAPVVVLVLLFLTSGLIRVLRVLSNVAFPLGDMMSMADRVAEG